MLRRLVAPFLTATTLAALAGAPAATAASALPTSGATAPGYAGATPAGPGPPESPPASGTVVRLSNETTYTSWSLGIDPGPIRNAPSRNAPIVAHLQLFTSDGFPQPYVLLRERRLSSGSWVLLRIPGRPNGRTGWVRRGDLDVFGVVHTQLVLDRAARSLTLYRYGHEVLRVPVGVGKPSTPTPGGHFWITEKFAVPNDPFYGPYAMGTSDYSTLTEWPGGGVVGLHGTNAPQLVPGAPSHGCVRLHNGDVLRLARLAPLGTPLLIE